MKNQKTLSFEELKNYRRLKQEAPTRNTMVMCPDCAKFTHFAAWEASKPEVRVAGQPVYRDSWNCPFCCSPQNFKTGMIWRG